MPTTLAPWTTVEHMNRSIPTEPIRQRRSRVGQFRTGLLALCLALTATINSSSGASVELRSPDKSTWSIVKVVHSPRAVLFGVSCSSSAHCVAVGRAARGYSSAGFAVVRSSGHWSSNLDQQIAEFPTTLSAVSCPSSRWCAAVGAVTSAFYTTPLIDVWNGRRWVGLSDPYDYSLQGELLGVSCPSPSQCVAVGSRFARRSTPSVAVLDGRRWSFRTATGLGDPPGALYAVSCLSLHFCMAVGSQGTGSAGTTLAEEWDGVVWRVVPGPAGVSKGANSRCRLPVLRDHLVARSMGPPRVLRDQLS
jgi:hypothetical protein